MGEQIASTLFSAISFAGASFLFSKINHSGYTAEMKRHNLEMEKYTRERDEFQKAREKEIDRVQKLHYDQKMAEQDDEETLDEFTLYARKYEKEHHKYDVNTVKKIFDQQQPINRYKPSTEMNKYITFVKYVLAGAISTGVVLLI